MSDDLQPRIYLPAPGDDAYSPAAVNTKTAHETALWHASCLRVIECCKRPCRSCTLVRPEPRAGRTNAILSAVSMLCSDCPQSGTTLDAFVHAHRGGRGAGGTSLSVQRSDIDILHSRSHTLIFRSPHRWESVLIHATFPPESGTV